MILQEVTTEQTANVLSHGGVRVSAQRLAIMRHLMEHRTHPTVDEIYRDLHPEHPALSRTTVYNTLRLLLDNGMVKCIDGGPEGARWDYTEKDHAHFLCRRCGRVTDLDFTPTLPQARAIPKGYVATSAELTLRGVCARCAGES